MKKMYASAGMAALAAVVAAAWLYADESASIEHGTSGPVVVSAASFVPPPPAAGAMQLEQVSPAPDPAEQPGMIGVARNDGKAAFLPTEQKLMFKGSISVAAVERLLTGKQFEVFVETMETESARDADAQQLTAAYREALHNQLQQSKGSMRLTGFACGLSLCVGTIRAHSDEDAYEGWSRRLMETGEPRHSSFVDYPQALGGGDVDHRFVLSVDPSIAGFSGSGSPLRR